MAFTRKALKDLGLTDEHIDKVMTLHGTSMAGYVPQSEVDTKVKEALDGADLKDLREKAGKADDLTKELEQTHFNYAFEDFLKGKGVKGGKALTAAKALFDPEKLKYEKGALTGADEQYAELIKDESVTSIFGKQEDTTPPTKNPNKPVFGNEPKPGGQPLTAEEQIFQQAASQW